MSETKSTPKRGRDTTGAKQMSSADRACLAWNNEYSAGTLVAFELQPFDEATGRIAKRTSMMIVNNGRGVTQIITGHGNTQVAGRDYFEGGLIRNGRNFGTVIGKNDLVEQRSGPLGFRVEVTLPNVASLRISGAGNLIYHDVQQDELSLDVSGAGTIDVTGKVNRLEADVSGAGDIAAYLLSAAHGRLRVSGAGNIKATATESVVARVSGVGKIKIAGNPAQRDTDVSGIGKIKFVDGSNA